MWTPEQQLAINKRDATILVSAAAGSGKTAVLTERVLSRILGEIDQNPIEIDRFLIVTFTNAAAQEMKERITQKLSAELDKLYAAPEENAQKIAYLLRQMALISKASISTIHSFCLKTIKSYFNVLDIDPNLRIGSDSELSMIRNDILEDLMDTYLEEEDANFLKLAEVYGDANSLDRLKAIILELDLFSKSMPFPLEWLNQQVEKLKKPYTTLSELPWAEQLKKQIQDTIESSLMIYEKAIKLCKKPNGPERYETQLEQEVDYFKKIQQDTTLETMIEMIQNINFKSLPKQKKGECDETLKNQVQDYRNLVKDEIKVLKDNLKLVQDEVLLSQLPKVGQVMETLVHVIEQFEQNYTEAKKEAGLCDYNDLEHYCLKLLIQKDADGQVHYTDVAKELSEFYEEVYIDEYQDSNAVQETLLQAISEASSEHGATRFLVGDMKQSIYRFRLANPLIFAQKYQEWDNATENLNASHISIDLSKNFRSRDIILEAVNDLFEQIMSPEVGELDYNEAAKLKVGNPYTDGLDQLEEQAQLSHTVELHILKTDEKENDIDEELEDLKNIEYEARMVADLIQKLLKGEGNPTHIYDKSLNAYRRVKASDIVILLRSPSNKAEFYETALEAIGIGAYSENQNSFFDTIEVKTMISLLKMIDNPLQDIPTLTVLRSPIVGLSFDELVMIRKSLPEGHFFEALQVYTESLEESHVLKHFMKQLEIYREESTTLKIETLLSKLYIETGYYQAVSMLPSGMIKKANLDLLKHYAMQYESNQNGHLFGFLHYLDKLQATKEGLKVAKLIPSHEDLVQIMSIHKSKGLEFSIVFLCDTGKPFNKQDLSKDILIHQDLGIAPHYLDVQQYVQYPSLPRLALKEQIKAEMISEELRILYVALTRAKEKLFITGTAKDEASKIEKWRIFADRQEKQILPYAIKKYCTYLDWIGMSLYAHEQVKDLRGKEPLEYLFTGKSKWKVEWHNKIEIGTIEQKTQLLDKKSDLENWDTAVHYTPYKSEIERRLTFVYPHQKAIFLPTKVSVSEIKRNSPIDEEAISLFELEPPEVEVPMPSFMQTKQRETGARRGTLLHSIFEHLDYLKYTSEEAIQTELEKLVLEKKIEPEALKVVHVGRLAQMSQSPLIEKMRHAHTIEKEKAFIYLAPATLVDASYPQDEQILIQGIIDAYFIDEEGITLIDYKTDYIDSKNRQQEINRLKKRYKKQIEMYAIALENLLKIPVVHKVIYLYNINDFITYETI